MRVIKSAVRIAVIAYIAAMAILFAFQRRLFYYPTHTWIPLAEAHANAAYREVAVTTGDGVHLKAWYAPARSKRFTIVFFHGNADFLADAAETGDGYIAAGYGFLAAEYRGYSGLEGKPTEKGLYADGRAYVQYLIGEGVDPGKIILFGQSLGTGVATELATEFRVGGLMLLSPFISTPRVAQVHYPIFPTGLIVLDRYENGKKIGSVHAPILIVNGTVDDVVPPAQGKELYELAGEPREFHSIPGRGHNDINGDFVPVSLEWMERVCGAGRL